MVLLDADQNELFLLKMKMLLLLETLILVRELKKFQLKL